MNYQLLPGLPLNKKTLLYGAAVQNAAVPAAAAPAAAPNAALKYPTWTPPAGLDAQDAIYQLMDKGLAPMLMHANEYAVVRNDNETVFQQAVNAKLRQGFLLHGRTFWANGNWHQGLVKMNLQQRRIAAVKLWGYLLVEI